MRDSHFNFHQKIAMLSILIYIFFIISSFLRFFIWDCVIPVSPVTPNLNSSPEKRSNIWAVIAWFPFQFPPEKCYVIYFDLYVLMISSFFRFFICDCVIPVSPVTPNLNSSPEKRSNIWVVIASFPFQFPPENCYVIYFDLYILYVFFFF